MRNIITVFLITSYLAVDAQLPFRLSKEQSLASNSEESVSSSEYEIQNDSLLYSHINGSVLSDIVLFNPKLSRLLNFKNCTYFLPLKLIVTQCYFKDYSNFKLTTDCNGYKPNLNLLNGFGIVNSRFTSELDISYLTCNGPSQLIGNRAGNINLSGDNFTYLSIESCTLDRWIKLVRTNASEFRCISNKFNEDSFLSLRNSTITEDLQLVGNLVPKVFFDDCQFSGTLSVISWTTPTTKIDHTDIFISNSTINSNCSVAISGPNYSSKLIFESCTFGPSASLFNLKVDTIVFKNCNNIPHPLFLTSDTSKTEIRIELINSNVNNIRFDYTDRFKLFFDKNVSEETKNNTYQSLFAKYKAEGKPQNLEKIDIEYKRYLYKSNWTSWPIWLMDYLWWRYGYSKWLVIAWSFLFIGIFFFYNYKNWEGMRKIYGVFDKEDLSLLGVGQNAIRLRKKIIYVLLFTSFIFFSIRVDFDKLKYANNKYLILFFTQYIVGLICLFFLANAIFKL